MLSLHSTEDSSEQINQGKGNALAHSAKMVFAGVIFGIISHTGYKYLGEDESKDSQMITISETSGIEQEILARIARDKAVNCMNEYAILNSHGGYFCKSGNEWYYVIYPYNGKRPTIQAVKPPKEKYLYEAQPVFQGESIEF